MPKPVTIRIDYENNAARWWSEARLRRAEAPEACRPLLLSMFREDVVKVSSEEAEAFQAWGAKIPGWEDGPRTHRSRSPSTRTSPADT